MARRAGHQGHPAPGDAALAREHGVDGIIVSNHGGRQLDGAVPPLLALPGVWTLPATCR